MPVKPRDGKLSRWRHKSLAQLCSTCPPSHCAAQRPCFISSLDSHPVVGGTPPSIPQRSPGILRAGSCRAEAEPGEVSALVSPVGIVQQAVGFLLFLKLMFGLSLKFVHIEQVAINNSDAVAGPLCVPLGRGKSLAAGFLGAVWSQSSRGVTASTTHAH